MRNDTKWKLYMREGLTELFDFRIFKSRPNVNTGDMVIRVHIINDM